MALRESGKDNLHRTRLFWGGGFARMMANSFQKKASRGCRFLMGGKETRGFTWPG